jgi:GT2 family glycosyltransferase
VTDIAVIRLRSRDGKEPVGVSANRDIRGCDADVVLFVPDDVTLGADAADRHLAAHLEASAPTLVIERLQAGSTPFGQYMTARTNGLVTATGEIAPGLRWLLAASTPRRSVLDAGGLSEDPRLAPVLLLDLEARLRANGARVSRLTCGGSAAPVLDDVRGAARLLERVGAALPALYEVQPMSVGYTDLSTLLACPLPVQETAAALDVLIGQESEWRHATSVPGRDDALLLAVVSGWHRLVTECLARGAQNAWPEAAAIARTLPAASSTSSGFPSVYLGNPRQSHGLRVVAADGATEPTVVAGRRAEQIRRGPTGARVLYAAIDYPPADREHAIAIVVEFLDAGRSDWTVQYDSRDAAICYPPERPGAFKSAAPMVTHLDSGFWRTARFVLDDWRFERACHGADFRIVVDEAAVDDPIVHRITVEPAVQASAERTQEPARTAVPVSLASSAAPLVSIVIPVHDRLEFTAACLRALEGSTRVPFETIVVDNGSTDGTDAFVDRCRGVRRIGRADNGGFAVACNDGARAARADVLVFLNNDTLPVAGWLDALHDALMSRPGVAVAGAKLLFARQDARVQHAGMWFEGFQPLHRHLFAPAIEPAACTSGIVPAVTGACLAIRRDEFLASGGFDTGFRNGYEEVDLCLRLLERGRATYYCAECVVFHHAGVSAGRFGHEAENRARFLDRWGASLPALLRHAGLLG